VTPARNGSTVLLKQFSHGLWRTIQVRRLERGSTYAFVVQPLRPGLKLYRVVKPREGAIRKGISPTRSLTAYATRSLIDLPWPHNTGFAIGEATIGSVQYPDAVIGLVDQSHTVSLAIDLKGKCRTLTGVVGLTPDSSTDARATVEISAGGINLLTQTFGPTDTANLSARVTGAKLLHITVTGVAGDSSAAIGAPIVRCAF
jgi:hypothetical protein